MYYDKNGYLIKNGDLLDFDDLGMFRVVCINGHLALKKCNDNKYPTIYLYKIFLNSHVQAAIIADFC